LSTASKHFIDTIKIVAYRAECAMTNIVREFMPKPDQARALIATLHATETVFPRTELRMIFKMGSP
jgi:hypothetical protein